MTARSTFTYVQVLGLFMSWRCTFAFQSTYGAPLRRFVAHHSKSLPTLLANTANRQSKKLGVDGQLSLAVFAQVGNTEHWSDLRKCVESVAAVSSAKTDLHLALLTPDEAIATEASKISGIGQVHTQVVENRGADLGEFLQQLEHVSRIEAEGKYDLIFKIHSKNRPDWRNLMISSLCGSPSQVDGILSQFQEADKKVSLVGPKTLVFTPYTNPNNVWGGLAHAGFTPDVVKGMERTWHMIDSGSPLPPKRSWYISAGTFFWSRADAMLYNNPLLAAIPELLSAVQSGYVKPCLSEGCKITYALERLLPTLAGQYGEVVEAADIHHSI